MGEQSLSHWITKKVLFFFFFFFWLTRFFQAECPQYLAPGVEGYSRSPFLKLRVMQGSQQLLQNLLGWLRSGVLLARRAHMHILSRRFFLGDLTVISEAWHQPEDCFPQHLRRTDFQQVLPACHLRYFSLLEFQPDPLAWGLCLSRVWGAVFLGAPPLSWAPWRLLSLLPLCSLMFSLTPTNQAVITPALCEWFCILHCPQRFTI